MSPFLSKLYNGGLFYKDLEVTSDCETMPIKLICSQGRISTRVTIVRLGLLNINILQS